LGIVDKPNAAQTARLQRAVVKNLIHIGCPLLEGSEVLAVAIRLIRSAHVQHLDTIAAYTIASASDWRDCRSLAGRKWRSRRGH